jgi:hypothetical protein
MSKVHPQVTTAASYTYSTIDLEGSVTFAAVLSSSRYVGLIGGGSAPVFSPNKFVLWEHQTASEPFKIEYNMIPLRACLASTHYCVVFELGVTLYKLDPQSHQNNNTSRVGNFDTAPNKHALCQLGQKKLVIPGRSKGQIQIVDLATKRISILPAHESAIRMFAMNKDESVLATAGDKGTLIKLWSTDQEASIMQFRRGLEHASIFSIAFSPSGDQMAVTSDKSTIHIFDMPWRQEQSADSTQARPDSRGAKRISFNPVPSAARDMPSPLSSSPRSRTYGASPPTPIKYGVSPSSVGKYKLGTSPSERISTSPSDISGYGDQGMAQGWPEMPSKHTRTASRRSVTTTGGMSDVAAETEKPTKRLSQKYGNLGNLPLAPRFFKDTYSSMNCKFEMGDEPTRRRESSKGKDKAGVDDDTASVTTVRTTATASREKENPWWPQGRPPKGKIAWVDDESLVVIGAGRDARWENFVLGVDQNGQRGIERRGWRRYLEDEGVD